MVTHSKQYHSITEETFRGVYNDYYAALLKYAFVIVNNKEQAQDIVADLFCQLWNNRHNTTFHTNLKSYLFVCLRRLAHRHLQKTNTSEPFVFYDDENSMQDNNDPQSIFIEKQRIDILDELLDKLPPQRASIIRLRMAGLTYSEIASHLNITPKKVEYHLSAAVEILRSEVKSSPYLQPELAVVLAMIVLS